MASWCWICHNKVNNTYVWYQGDKCHPGCKKMKQDQALAREIRNAKKHNRNHLPPNNNPPSDSNPTT